MNAYVELHCHSNFSFLDGASHPWELVRRAADLEMPALALTDTGGVYGAVRFLQSCQAFGVRPLLGAALGVDGEEIVLLAKTLRGWSNLCRLLSLAHRDQPKGEARTTLDMAAQHRGDVFHLTGTRDERTLRTIQEALGRDAVFLELHNHLRAEDPWLVAVQSELGARCQAPTVVTNDVRYHDRDRRPLHDVLTAIRNRATLEEIHGQLPPNSEQVLKAGDELRPLFPGREDARTSELAQECTPSLPWQFYP
jgi:DNA polymerase III alpha subunit